MSGLTCADDCSRLSACVGFPQRQRFRLVCMLAVLSSAVCAMHALECLILQRPESTPLDLLNAASRQTRVTVLQCLHFTSGLRRENPLPQPPLASNWPTHSRGSEVEARDIASRATLLNARSLLLYFSHSFVRDPGHQKALLIQFEDTSHHTTHHRLTTPLHSFSIRTHTQQSSTHHNTIHRNSNTTPRAQHAAPKHYPRVYAPLRRLRV